MVMLVGSPNICPYTVCSPTGGLSVDVDMNSLSLSVSDILNFSLLTSLTRSYAVTLRAGHFSRTDLQEDGEEEEEVEDLDL